MQDVFEPMANFTSNVFEPMNNFDGEVFEPMSNFKGEGGGSGNAYAEAGATLVQGIGQLSASSAQKKDADAKRYASMSDRQKELTDCEKNPSFKKFLDRKKRNNRIRDCQNEVNRRYDEKDKADIEIANKTLDTQKEQLSLQASAKKDSTKSSSDKFLGMPKNVGIGVTIGVGVLLIGVATFLIIRKRK